jgi:hypothetical protein
VVSAVSVVVSVIVVVLLAMHSRLRQDVWTGHGHGMEIAWQHVGGEGGSGEQVMLSRREECWLVMGCGHCSHVRGGREEECGLAYQRRRRTAWT